MLNFEVKISTRGKHFRNVRLTGSGLLVFVIVGDWSEGDATVCRWCNMICLPAVDLASQPSGDISQI